MRTAPGRKKVSWVGWLAQRVGLRRMPLGDRGEIAAAKFLRKQGVKIVARNRVHGKGEIDLIGIEGEFLVFVEVRTRRSEGYMRPEDSIRYRKRKKLVGTVRGLMRRHWKKGLRPRIDVVAVVWPAGERRPAEIRWHRGVIGVGGW
ncbi:MAG TPA: YraN family protein [Phycisphaerae bacterium]|nr:YraN family protein [Phycisphaerae bacterium]